MPVFRLIHAVIAISCLFCSPFAYAAEGKNKTDDNVKERFAELIEERKQESAGVGSLPKLQAPFSPSGVKLSAENQVIQQQAIKEYFQHIIESNEHQRRVFSWQLLSAKIIFAVVVVLVAAGIYFAAVQFHHGLSSGKQSEQETEFEASLKGIKVSSPVLGVIILTISLAFFYLYLVHVYPIEFVRG